MKEKEKLNSIDLIDEKFIEEAAPYNAKPMFAARSRMIKRAVLIAACVALMLSAVIVLTLFRKDEPDISEGTQEPPFEYDHYTPIPFDATLSPEKLSGSNMTYVVGNSSSGKDMEEPPIFEFSVLGFIVKAKVVENYPDTYSKLYEYYARPFSTYRLVKMEVVEVVNGEDMPHEFLYLIPEPIFIDMSEYDYLLISMSQIGTEGFTIKNCTKNQIEVLDLPLFFENKYGRPDLGSVIAFNDDMFDESLWKNPKWSFGYQFVQNRLENPNESHLVVKRGDSIDNVIDKIRADQEYYRIRDNYTPPKPVTLDFSSQDAKAVLDYVKPFENGVFAQHLEYSHIYFIRIINGCETDERIMISFDTEKVTDWNGARYTEEELKNIENMAMQLEAKAAEYKNQLPAPSNPYPGKVEFIRLSLQASYMKVDGRIYGVLNIEYIYRGVESEFSNIKEEVYILYDMQNSETQSLSWEEYRKRFDHLYRYVDKTPD